MKERDASIDIAKGLGILLVAAGHSDAWADMGADWVKPAIFSFHVPLFLFLSGCFPQAERPFLQVLRRRSASLLLPYLAFVLAYLVGRGGWQDVPEGLARAAWGTGQSLGWPWTPAWFLPHLLLAVLASWGIHRTWGRLRLPLWLWPLLGAVLLLLGKRVFAWEDASQYALWERKIGVLGLPWSLDLLPLTLPYLLLAPFWKTHGARWTSRSWSFPLLAAAAILLHWRSGWTLDLNMRTCESLGGSFLQALLGILATLSLAALLARLPLVRPAFASIGRASLWILLSHAWIQCSLCSHLSPGDDDPSLRVELLGFLGGWLLPWALHVLHEDLTPRVAARIAAFRAARKAPDPA